MTTTTRGKIQFIMPDSWSEEQTNSFADKIIDEVKPKIIKLSKSNSYTTESVGHDRHHKSPKESDK